MATVDILRAENGALIEVDDCAYAGISDEEMQKRIENMLETAARIAENSRLRLIAAESEERADE